MPNIPLEHWLVIFSALISIFGAYFYIRDTLRGKTKPNRVTWSMWALAPLIGMAAAIHSQADIWATIRIFLAGFLPLIVVLCSFLNKQSYWKLSFFDLLCGAFSCLALIVWLAIDLPKIAILLAAIGDGFAALPTIKKAWFHPETETGITYLASLISVAMIIPAIPEWNIENSAFQIYLLITNTLLVFAIYRKKISRIL